MISFEDIDSMYALVPGAMGSSSSLALRGGQIVFSSASLLFMSFRVQFYGYTSFCFLVIVMGLMILWSTTLAMVEAYYMFLKRTLAPPRRKIMWVVTTGDWVMSFLSLAVACSTAGVIELLMGVGEAYCPIMLCTRYQMSATTAFFTWILSFASATFNLCLLPCL